MTLFCILQKDIYFGGNQAFEIHHFKHKHAAISQRERERNFKLSTS